MSVAPSLPPSALLFLSSAIFPFCFSCMPNMFLFPNQPANNTHVGRPAPEDLCHEGHVAVVLSDLKEKQMI